MKNIDLRVLAIVSELSRTRSVSQTAEALGLSQSAVSMSLAKLRKHFNDPLFVRTSVGMEPTPHAAEVIKILREAEDLLQTALGYHVVFDSKTSDRLFTIHSTDIAQITFLPEMMKVFGTEAPNIRIELRRMNEETPKHLESGEADLAIGFMPPLGAGYEQQQLFRERLVCVVREGHPRIRESITLAQYLAEQHVAVSTQGTGHSVVEKTLAAQRLERHVALTLPSFLGVAPMMVSLDYVATIPERLAQHLLDVVPIRILPLPIDVPPYLIVQQWHERYTHDPASRWLRASIARMFASGKSAAPGKAGAEDADPAPERTLEKVATNTSSAKPGPSRMPLG